MYHGLMTLLGKVCESSPKQQASSRRATASWTVPNPVQNCLVFPEMPEENVASLGGHQKVTLCRMMTLREMEKSGGRTYRLEVSVMQ